jgi:hypothetical protein
MATTWPRRRSAWAMRSLSSGETRAAAAPVAVQQCAEHVVIGGQALPHDDELVLVAITAEQADLAGDGAGGLGMVAADHRHPDPSPPAGGDRRRGPRAGRILEGDQPQQRQVALGGVRRVG